MKKFGIVGIGGIAQAYINVLGDADFACLTAVADSREEAVEAASEANSCKGFSTHQAMADAAELDAVIVSTPPATHPEIAIHFLERGIPVLCEKPIAINEQHAREIIAAGRKNDTLVSMASKFRFVDDVIRAKSVLASGMCGDILLMENFFTAPVEMATRWNSDPTVSGGGVWIDNGTHSADIIRYLLGPITEVQMVANTFDKKLDVEDNVFMHARTKAGTVARVDLSWTFDKGNEDYLRFFGTKGVMHVGWRGCRFKQNGNSDWTTFGSGYDKNSAFRNNLRNFCGSIDGAEQPLISTDDALASVQVVHAAYVSARTNGWVEVQDAAANQPADDMVVPLAVAE